MSVFIVLGNFTPQNYEKVVIDETLFAKTWRKSAYFWKKDVDNNYMIRKKSKDNTWQTFINIVLFLGLSL